MFVVFVGAAEAGVCDFYQHLVGADFFGCGGLHDFALFGAFVDGECGHGGRWLLLR